MYVVNVILPIYFRYGVNFPHKSLTFQQYKIPAIYPLTTVSPSSKPPFHYFLACYLNEFPNRIRIALPIQGQPPRLNKKKHFPRIKGATNITIISPKVLVQRAFPNHTLFTHHPQLDMSTYIFLFLHAHKPFVCVCSTRLSAYTNNPSKCHR